MTEVDQSKVFIHHSVLTAWGDCDIREHIQRVMPFELPQNLVIKDKINFLCFALDNNKLL